VEGGRARDVKKVGIFDHCILRIASLAKAGWMFKSVLDSATTEVGNEHRSCRSMA
jgi:hypothetical protein